MRAKGKQIKINWNKRCIHNHEEFCIPGRKIPGIYLGTQKSIAVTLFSRTLHFCEINIGTMEWDVVIRLPTLGAILYATVFLFNTW